MITVAQYLNSYFSNPFQWTLFFSGYSFSTATPRSFSELLWTCLQHFPSKWWMSITYIPRMNLFRNNFYFFSSFLPENLFLILQYLIKVQLRSVIIYTTTFSLYFWRGVGVGTTVCLVIPTGSLGLSSVSYQQNMFISAGRPTAAIMIPEILACSRETDSSSNETIGVGHPARHPQRPLSILCSGN